MFKIFNRYPELFHTFSEKKDGSMKYFQDAQHQIAGDENIKNRKRFLRKFSIDIKDIAYAELGHGSNISVIESDSGLGVVKNCDGLITGRENIFLSVTAADCLPIYLFEPEKKIVGMIHAGWRSL